MTIDVQTMIEKRPHLKDPLQLYVRWLQFDEYIRTSLPRERQAGNSVGTNGYPLTQMGDFFDRFTAMFDLPAEDFAPLRAMLVAGKIDFLRLPVGEVVQVDGLDCTAEDVAKVLFLFTRPYFQQLRLSHPLDGSVWQGGRCPLCSAQAALTSIVEGPKRQLHCSWCGTVGSYRYIGCPTCGSEQAVQFTTIEADGEPGFRVLACSGCNGYVKAVEGPILKKMGPDLADLASLPLDIVAQEKGFTRAVPNPIALQDM